VILTALRRGIRRRCPHCGQGPLFSGWAHHLERCSVCGLVYERNPGDTWAFTIIGDRLPVAAIIVMIYFGYGRTHHVLGLITFALLGIVLVWTAPNRAKAEAALTLFADKYAPKYQKAVECLTKDREALLAFYDFPAEHWKHLRTTNPIESTFATVRHRTIRAKGCLSNKTALAMVFKLVEGAQKSWRRLDGHNQLPKLILGVKFSDGLEVTGRSIRQPATAAA
jgi:uncharacterized protein (DUF983 family)